MLAAASVSGKHADSSFFSFPLRTDPDQQRPKERDTMRNPLLRRGPHPDSTRHPTTSVDGNRNSNGGGEEGKSERAKERTKERKKERKKQSEKEKEDRGLPAFLARPRQHRRARGGEHTQTRTACRHAQSTDKTRMRSARRFAPLFARPSSLRRRAKAHAQTAPTVSLSSRVQSAALLLPAVTLAHSCPPPLAAERKMKETKKEEEKKERKKERGPHSIPPRRRNTRRNL